MRDDVPGFADGFDPLPGGARRRGRDRLRRADLRRARGAAAATARSGAASSPSMPPPARRRVPGPHAGPRAAGAAAGGARRSTCSASATTTRPSTATPAPTPRSSIDFAELFPGAGDAPARGQLPLPGGDRRRRPPTCSATTGVRVPRRSVPRPAPMPAAGALEVRVRPAAEAATTLVDVVPRLARRARTSGRRRRRARPASTRCCSRPTCALPRPGSRSPRRCAAEVLERTGVRGRARLAAHRRRSRRRARRVDVDEIRRRPSRGLPQWITEWLAELPLGRRPARASATAHRRRGVPARSTSWPTTSGCSPGSPAAGGHDPGAARRPSATEIGLGGAMEPARRLDGRRGGSSHLDDLEGAAAGRRPPRRAGGLRAVAAARSFHASAARRGRAARRPSTGSRGGSGTGSRSSAPSRA